MNIPVQFTQAFQLNTTPKSLLLTDTTNYASQGITDIQVKGCFQLKNQYGGIFYSNTNFASPDIHGTIFSPALNTFTTNAPLDSKGRVLNGMYDLTYKVEISAEAFSLPLTGISLPFNAFGVAGNQLQNVLNAIGGNIIITGGANAGTYTITVADCQYDAPNNITIIAVLQPIPSGTDLSSPITFTVNTTYTTTNTIQYGFQEPCVNIEAIDDCFKSLLTVSDLTNFDAINNGVTLIPASINGTMTINYPLNPVGNVPMASPVVVSINNAGIVYNVNPICTGVFQIEYNVTVVYILPGGTTLTVVLTGKKDHEVKCESGLCCALQCIENVYRNWNKARGSNEAEAESYQKLLLSILGCWMLYTTKSECGEGDPSKWLAEIISLVKTHNCTCCPENSNTPVWITSSVTASGAASIVIAGTGITVTPTGTNPVTYTVALDQTVVNGLINTALNNQSIFGHTDTAEIAPLLNGQVLMKMSSGMWSNVTLGMANISDIDKTGAVTGYALIYNTVTSKASFLPIVFHNVLINDWTAVGTGADLTTDPLKSFTIPANTLKNAGDFVTIDAGFVSGNGTVSGSNNVLFYFGATPTLINTFSLSTNKNTSFEFKVSMVNGTTLAIEFTIKQGVLPSTVFSNVWVSVTESASNPLIIQFKGENTIAVANTIVQSYLRSVLNSI